MNTHTHVPVRVLMVAIGGYGYHYLQALLNQVSRTEAVLAGVVDPEARISQAWPQVERLGVPVAPTVDGFYAAGHRADLAVIASPIQHHVPQACSALLHGSHVLCDKPIGATVQEARQLADTRDRTQRFVMIGYQWSYSRAIQALKRDILDGRFGKPVRFAALCCWPRDAAYYQRNCWAGRLRDPETRRWVLDSPANNGMAHFLHNLLYLAGPELRSAVPGDVRAEMSRAYSIESADTAACRVRTKDGVQLDFYASHATEQAVEPRFRLEFEDGRVTFGEETPAVVGRGPNGFERVYGAPDDTPQFTKLFDAIAAVRRGGPVVCGVEAAAAHTLVVNGMHESAGTPVDAPPALVDHHGRQRSVRGLGEALALAYESGGLPSETLPWLRPGATVSVEQYDSFPAAGRLAEARR
jgi:predicted dehydrogenase